MSGEQQYDQGIIYDRRIVITPSGECITKYEAQKVVQSDNFEIPIATITKFYLLKELLLPDKYELFLLLTSLFLNFIIIGTFTGLSPFNPNMIIFWGIFNFILTMTRWSYWGPFHFQASMKLIEKELMKGNIVIDFKFAGIIFSIILILIGTSLS